MSDVKSYARQKKEPEMLNDFGPAGGYDCIYPGEPKLGNKSKSYVKVKKENMLNEYGKDGRDIMNVGEEVEEL